MGRMKNILVAMLVGFYAAAGLPTNSSANIIDTTYGAGAGSFETRKFRKIERFSQAALV